MHVLKLYAPEKMIYLTDKRQDLYFEQVFRCARKTKLVKPETELVISSNFFISFLLKKTNFASVM